MPFVQRTIEPKYLSRKSLFDENGKSLVSDFELEAVTNNTLTNVLRQLASIVLVANDIFEDLAKQLHDVYERSCKLKTTIEAVEGKLLKYDPKTVTVPESDICTFSLRTIHFKSSHPLTTALFTTTSRPKYLQKLYESAAPTPVHTIRHLDRFRRDGTRSSKFFVCTPVLGGRRKRYKKVDLEIETRKPMAVEDLRRWTSMEALGDITVLPDNTSKIPAVEVTEGEVKDEVDHLLPSPEEQMMAVAMKFPPSIVAVDISGKPFERMSGMRRSLTGMELNADGGAVPKRRTKRRHREKRRNTIAGTSQKEIQQAIAGETTTETEGCEFDPPLRSKSTDLFKLPKTTLSPTDNIKNHFNTLKNWSKTKLKFMSKNNSFDSCKPSFQGTDVVDDIGIYETVSSGSKHRREKERKPSSSSSAISIPASTASSIATSLVVKLRENSLQRKHWRKGTSKGQDEPAHSSSGNWSASSESGRTSIASETTVPPKSSTTTSNNSLNHHNHHHHHPPPSVQTRRRYLNASTSSSVSEGTLTPDINEMQYHDLLDGETSSVYSCDTEGYYTSFHMDSGLKTLKEEEVALSFSTLQLQEETGPTTTSFNNTSSSGSSSVKANQLTAENEYELFGKGSTSTTTSSAGTVCTTLLAGNAYGSSRSLTQFAPAVPERKSSLERKTDKKQAKKTPEPNEIELISDSENNDELETTRVVALIHDSPSPDSGHNTSSSPAESASQNSQSPHEHLEFSESDVESCDRAERIRNKTAMTTCRIPSMCMITPPQSDDEVNLRNCNLVPYGLKYVPLNPYGSVQNEVKNNLSGKLFPRANGGKTLHIQIPKVPDLKKEITDIYAYPDKSKKTKLINTVKTVSTNGVLETNLDGVVDDAKDSLHLLVNGETGYATIKNETKKTHRSPSPSGGVMIVKDKEEIPKPSQPVLKSSLLPSNFMEKFREVINKQKKPEKKNDDGDYVMIIDTQKSPKPNLKQAAKEESKSEYVSLNELPASKNQVENPLQPSSNDSSLERKKRQGARVTLDSDGKVVYSSDSLKRKKQHSTFIPGKYVRESPTPSPLLDKRVSKPIRPVNCSGLIRTNSDDRKADMSPQLGKLIIKAGTRNCDSPTKDFVRLPPTRVVTPTGTPRRNERGVRIVLENGHRSASPALSDTSSLERRKRDDRCTSPSSSSSSSNDNKKPEIDINAEEGKILNEKELDALGENFDSEFSRLLDSMKLDVLGCSLSSNETNEVPDIFRIEPEVPNLKRPVKRSDSYRMANCSLSIATDFSITKLATVTENLENFSTKTKCKISIDDPNYQILMKGEKHKQPNGVNSGTQLRIDPSIFFIQRKPPNRVTKPTDTELAKLKGAKLCLSYTNSAAVGHPLIRAFRNIKGSHQIPPRWISRHPAVSQPQQFYSKSGFPRSHPMYWTLPSRAAYAEGNIKDSKEEKNAFAKVYQDVNQKSPSKSFNRDSSSQETGAMEPSHGLTSLRLVQRIQRKEFTSSTPTKEPLQNSNALNLNGMSPILKENIFNSKSKMTAEEIFAAIHKSKKKLNIKDDAENRSESPSSSSLSPDGSECSLGNKSRERSSWSPNTCDLDMKTNEPRTRKSWIGASTPINSFKKLLLQQGIKNPMSKELKISAVEQLKLSKPEKTFKSENKTPSRMVLNNSRTRSSWRYASPRTDILSSTIPEDCSEVEKSDESLRQQKISPRFSPSHILDHENLYTGTDIRDSKFEVSKPRENRSLEITKKYLQQARKNFFSEPVSPKNIGFYSPARKQLNFSGVNGQEKKPEEPVLSPTSYNHNSFSIDRKKTPFISLETAL